MSVPLTVPKSKLNWEDLFAIYNLTCKDIKKNSRKQSRLIRTNIVVNRQCPINERVSYKPQWTIMTTANWTKQPIIRLMKVEQTFERQKLMEKS